VNRHEILLLMSEATRQFARQIFAEAMAATTVESACTRLLSIRDNILHAGDQTFNLATFTNTQIISIGKAGATLFDAVRTLLPADLPTRSIISAPFPPQHLTSSDQYFPGGHPLPNAASIAAASAALKLLNTATDKTLILFLISGGASAMFEQPIDPRLTLADLIDLNRQLVASGTSIRQINTVRKHISAVKGGRLATAAPTATKLSLLISDVPTDSLDALASGPTLPDPTTKEQALAIMEQYLPTSRLPSFSETPKPSHPAFHNAHHVVLLDNAALLEAAKQSAERLGFAVNLDNTCDDWDYEQAASYLLNRAAQLACDHKKSCLLSGGEVTVCLPAISGAGGRNQQLALFAARHLTGTTILSAGSDGIDGNSLAAGAVADETTWPRARQQGLNPADFLTRFDTTTLFTALDDTLLTGPSGNNLRDIRILLSGVDG
jgi:glycerate 2-kinase